MNFPHFCHKHLGGLNIPLTHTQVTVTNQMCCHGNPLRALSPISGITNEQAQLNVLQWCLQI